LAIQWNVPVTMPSIKLYFTRQNGKVTDAYTARYSNFVISGFSHWFYLFKYQLWNATVIWITMFSDMTRVKDMTIFTLTGITKYMILVQIHFA